MPVASFVVLQWNLILHSLRGDPFQIGIMKGIVRF
jgi:hypothetical protein